MAKGNPNPSNKFKPGNQYGRAVGGRRKCIDGLDKMLSKAENQKAYEDDLQIKFDEGPVDFVYKYVYPLLPKNIEITGLDGSPIETIDLSKLTENQLEQYIKLTEKANS